MKPCLEYWARVIRFPFVAGLAVVGYFAVVNLTSGNSHTVLHILFWPFYLATLFVEFLEINKLDPWKRKTKNKQNCLHSYQPPFVPFSACEVF